MFEPVSSRPGFAGLEEDILQFWRDIGALRLAEREREGAPLYVLYEGPPTANGEPGIHHVLSRVFKDVMPRYHTMRGFRPLRKGGWDTHGLPVELEVEKELGLSSKPEIEQYGIEAFNRRCKESVFRYVREWERLTERIAFWVDMENAYITYENDYIETGWWIVRQLWDRGLVYRGMSAVPHCPRCVTTLSSHEVALGYREDVSDPSVYALFRVVDASGAREPARRRLGGGDVYLMAWTTTPWTLPGNTALSVSPSASYALVRLWDGRRVVVAEALARDALAQEPSVEAVFPGSDLEGLLYEALFDPFEASVPVRRFRGEAGGRGLDELEEVEAAPPGGVRYPVVSSEFVSLEEGTGIVHIALAFGAEDYRLGRERGLRYVQPVDLGGKVVGGYGFSGRFVKEADPAILEELRGRGLLYREGVYRHTYPFCWRCDSPLLYYAKPSWYIRTTAARERLLSGNREIHWYPEHIREGRFGEWLRNNVDWAISRERYWGTPVPVWQCRRCGGYHCVGSVEEMKERMTPDSFTQYALGLLRRPEDLHRPYVDEVVLRCHECGGDMERVPDVLDCWFDSGAMPFAQWHYPFERRQEVDDGTLFPASYICEAVDQTRGWFYSLHALSTLLKGGPSYRNVICLGHVLDANGEKMSKSRENVIEPWEVIDAYGADALRWYLFSATPPGNSRRFGKHLVEEVVRRFLIPLWNVYGFFVTYANVDRVAPQDVLAWSLLESVDAGSRGELDRWLRSEVNLLVRDVTAALDRYDPTTASRRLEQFVDLLSNWYVRRSRRRFWKSENDQDKRSAYVTLYGCLVTLSKLLAPFIPFVAEAMYQNLVRSGDAEAPESVHVAFWPEVQEGEVDEELCREVAVLRRVASLGRAARRKASVKVRQPLSELVVRPRYPTEARALHRFEEELKEELNVKALRMVDDEEAYSLFVRLELDLSRVGPRLGGSTGRAREAFERADHAVLYADVVAGRGVEVEGFAIGADEVKVELCPADGYAAASEGGYLVGVRTELSSELRMEGMAREVVHRVQNMRRGAGFNIADRIVLYCSGEETVEEAVRHFDAYIRQETLAVEVRLQRASGEELYQEEHRVDGAPVFFAVARSG